MEPAWDIIFPYARQFSNPLVFIIVFSTNLVFNWDELVENFKKTDKLIRGGYYYSAGNLLGYSTTLLLGSPVEKNVSHFD